jgi:hypothetical protein
MAFPLGAFRVIRGQRKTLRPPLCGSRISVVNREKEGALA